MKRKGVYPYDCVDSVDKLLETALPPKETFYSKLNDEETTNEDHEHAKTELLTDIDMLLMFKDGIRGGVAMASTASVKQTIDIWLKIMIVVNLRNI